MVILLTVIHVLVCLFLIVVVLLQSGKAADLAGAFGGMGSQTAFGPRGSATMLSKATTVAAVLFMITSMTLSIIATRGGGTTSTILEKANAPAPTPAEVPAAAPGAQQPSTGPSVTFAPEGADPSQSVTVPLELPPKPGEEKGSAAPATPPSAPPKQ